MEAISHAKNLMRERCSMPKRSIRITLLNNTPFTLTFLASNRCHGDWTDLWHPPSHIPPKTQGAWQSESSGGIATGTEAWVKYILNTTDTDFATGQPCLPELVYIHWDNPFIWASDTKPLEKSVGTSDVTPPCDNDGATSGTFPPVAGTNPPGCRHELFVAGVVGPHISNV